MLGLSDDSLNWETLGTPNLLRVNQALSAPKLLFDKVEDEFVQQQVEKLHANRQ
jgi:methionyl-tRNA synthetase